MADHQSKSPASSPTAATVLQQASIAAAPSQPDGYVDQPPQPHHLHQQQQHLALIHQFWANQVTQAEQAPGDFRTHQLPLARIKKVMKTDDDVRTKMMISAEAPILFAKACEIFILELTMRAWIHTEENKRRTLQRSDIAAAISKSDVFDFLIDIVPRDEIGKSGKKMDDLRAIMQPEFQQQYYAAAQQYPMAGGSGLPGNMPPPTAAAAADYNQFYRQQQEGQQQSDGASGGSPKKRQQAAAPEDQD